jgi:outer membrane receptor protein involved in Fe transport
VHRFLRSIVALLFVVIAPAASRASDVIGTVRDTTGGVLPGVSVDLRGPGQALRTTQTDNTGRYRFDAVSSGRLQVSFTLPNFASVRRNVVVPVAGQLQLDAVMHLALSADVVVSGQRTFVNIADAENPAEDLVGIAASASQGAVTAHRLELRPVMRSGEVLESVPGLIVSQHSGEGKANQYYLRGFNLDHGTDFATTVAGMPVNMPSHGHGHGYSDQSFLIPELVSGVQYSKGPYFADQGDFSTAGAANINYASSLLRPIAHVSAGGDAFGRAFVAMSPRVGGGILLAAFEAGQDDGPWRNPDDYRKLNGLVRFTRGNAVRGFSITGMVYHGEWNSTDQIPRRAVDEGFVDRFSAIDTTDGGHSSRYSGSFDWQTTSGSTSTRLTAYGIGYDMGLWSNFTYFLDDQNNGDQFQQVDHRFVSGAKISHRRVNRWDGRPTQNTFGAQLRHDSISNGLYNTVARERLSTTRQDDVGETSAGVYAQNEIEWTPWLRSMLGVRGDQYHFTVTSDDPVNSGRRTDGIVSPKGGVVIGPFLGTEFYANAGLGFHSNDARGTTITRDPETDERVDQVTPLVRAKGAELGMRTVALPHLQSTVSLWSLNLDSELVFVGDAGTTEAGRPSRRYGIEFANYYSPRRWLTLDADLSWSHARFTDEDPAGDFIPGSVERVFSAGLTVDDVHGLFGSLRVRYFGPRPLVEDDSVRSEATSRVNLAAGYKLTPKIRLVFDVFNLFNAEDSDIDYYYGSRLPGEPAAGVEDVHFHPTLPRTARLGLSVSF